MMVQLWSTYSLDQQVYNEEAGSYELIDNRFNTQLRRARLGFKAQPYENLKFTIVAAYDLLGRDVLAATRGGSNNGAPQFSVWDVFFQWRLKKGSEAFNLVGGYFRPQMSRESITSGWSVNSMEKSMSQNYIRRHLVGRGPGRALGLNFGGLVLTEDENLGLQYHFGVFNPVYLTNNGNSVGKRFSPLVTARTVFYIGDPEQKKFKIGYDINYYGQRNGLSIGLAGAWQGETELFSESKAANVDILFNWGPLNIDADWNLMWREGELEIPDEHSIPIDYFSQTGHLRIGYNLIFKKIFLEPTAMIMHFDGGTSEAHQRNATALGSFSGKDYTLDVGINWYLNKKHLKLLLHYTRQFGELGEAPKGATPNQFFSQGGVGAIKRGDWIGIGVHAIF